MSFSHTVFHSCYKFQPSFLLTIVETSNEHKKILIELFAFAKLRKATVIFVA